VSTAGFGSARFAWFAAPGAAACPLPVAAVRPLGVAAGPLGVPAVAVDAVAASGEPGSAGASVGVTCGASAWARGAIANSAAIPAALTLAMTGAGRSDRCCGWR
jgi:hypothetical protein